MASVEAEAPPTLRSRSALEVSLIGIVRSLTCRFAMVRSEPAPLVVALRADTFLIVFALTLPTLLIVTEPLVEPPVRMPIAIGLSALSEWL